MSSPVLQTTTAAGVSSSLIGLLEGMRPVQWIKNGFVLAPLIFSANLQNLELGLRALAVFAAFSMVASGVYLWNDSLDWRNDLNHPQKKRRPIPSGRLTPAVAISCGSFLLIAGVLAGFALNLATGFLLFGYAILNGLYSLTLKHVEIVDLMCIAVGFVLRVIAGSTAIGVHSSHWLLMCTFLIALFLGIAKRRQEIVTLSNGSGQHRRVLAHYSLPWLDQAGTLVSGSTVVAYALYAVSPETQAKFGTDALIYTLPFVVFGVLRYLHMMHSGDRTGNPTSALMLDKQLLMCIAGWVLACAAIIYL